MVKLRRGEVENTKNTKLRFLQRAAIRKVVTGHELKV
jgi:hypothetical protein